MCVTCSDFPSNKSTKIIPDKSKGGNKMASFLPFSNPIRKLIRSVGQFVNVYCFTFKVGIFNLLFSSSCGAASLLRSALQFSNVVNIMEIFMYSRGKSTSFLYPQILKFSILNYFFLIIPNTQISSLFSCHLAFFLINYTKKNNISDKLQSLIN